MSPETTPPPMPSTPPPFMPPNLPPPPMQPEMVSLVIEKVQQKTGLFSKVVYRMLVTSTRLIFALQENNGVDYMHQDPNLSLAENPANFAIPLGELQQIEIYHGDFESNSPDTMTAKTMSNKMTFQIADAYRVGQNLKKMLGKKIK
jgi:hypothetical protein